MQYLNINCFAGTACGKSLPNLGLRKCGFIHRFFATNLVPIPALGPPHKNLGE